MSRKRTPNGEPRRFFEEAMLLDTNECIIWSYGGRGGYGSLSGEEGRPQWVHRLACERRNGPAPEDKPLAIHGPCHNRLCFNPCHLSWGSTLDNSLDRLRDGTAYVGEDSWFSRLTAEQVTEIRRRHADGEKQNQLAAEFNVSTSTVGFIVNRLTWKHLPETTIVSESWL